MSSKRFAPSRFIATICVTATTLLSGYAASVAQTSGGSSYSVLNIGDIHTSVSPAAAGRGGVEASVPSSENVNSTNPALWGELRNVTLAAAMTFSQYQVSDASGSLNQNRFGIENFTIGFPMSEKYRSGLAFSLRPYSTVNYRTQLEQQVPGVVSGDSAKATIASLGHGGLSEALLGASFAPVEWLTIGAAGSRYFGAIDRRTNIAFLQGSLNPAIYEENDLYTGWGGRFGLLINPLPELRIGAVLETGAELSRERHRISSYIDQSREVIDTTSVTSGSLTIPARITAGVSFVTGKFLLSAEGAMQGWGAEQFSTSRASTRLGAGVERLPSQSANASGFDKWAFRLGGYYDQTYYLLPANGINAMAVTAGFGVPLTVLTRLNVGTTLDFGAELGLRGTTDNGLTRELFGRFHFGFSVSEQWFVRSRR